MLQIVPVLGIFAIFAALYGLYLLYLGLPRLMKCPEDKAVAYTAVVVVCAIVLSVVITVIGGTIAGAGMIGAGALSGAAARRLEPTCSSTRTARWASCRSSGSKLEESNKKMEAAQKSGDEKAQAAAAFEGLGTLLGGGKRVEPVAIDQLKPFVPESFAGLPKTASSAEKTGIAGLMVSKAEAQYGDGAGKSVNAGHFRYRRRQRPDGPRQLGRRGRRERGRQRFREDRRKWAAASSTSGSRRRAAPTNSASCSATVSS